MLDAYDSELFKSVGIQSSSYQSPYAHHHTTLQIPKLIKILIKVLVIKVSPLEVLYPDSLD